jgi:hypothetical protein
LFELISRFTLFPWHADRRRGFFYNQYKGQSIQNKERERQTERLGTRQKKSSSGKVHAKKKKNVKRKIVKRKTGQNNYLSPSIIIIIVFLAFYFIRIAIRARRVSVISSPHYLPSCSPSHTALQHVSFFVSVFCLAIPYRIASAIYMRLH